MRGIVFHVPIETATTPADGACLVGHWWSIHPEKGLAFYAHLSGFARSEEPSPQCNASETTARHIAKKLYPDHEVRLIPTVFMAHAMREMNRLRAEKQAGKPSHD